MANNLEARIAGSAALANNLAARLDGVRDDALYAKVLFLFLGAPGVVLAALVTAAIAGAGRARRMREQALLRIRGATLIETLFNPAVEAAVIGLAGAAAGLLLAFIALRLMGVSVAAPTALGWGLFAAAAGLGVCGRDDRGSGCARRPHFDGGADSRPRGNDDAAAVGTALARHCALGCRGARLLERAGRRLSDRAGERGRRADIGQLRVVPCAARALGGIGLLWVRLSRRALIAARRVRNPVVLLTAGDLAPTVVASLSRQASRIARGAGPAFARRRLRLFDSSVQRHLQRTGARRRGAQQRRRRERDWGDRKSRRRGA